MKEIFGVYGNVSNEITEGQFRKYFLFTCKRRKIMNDAIGLPGIKSEIRELSIDEVNCVSGGGLSAGASAAAAAGIGAAAFGSGWGAVAVGAAVASAPIAVVAMVGLAAYAGYAFACSLR
ncbi:hypothetical protein [Massilia horti]|nr:hypothetical protein [Massilia horti]